jgi:SAM-dependent methyltransferase
MDANVEGFPYERREFHLQRYRFAADYCRDKRVLDGACGTGYGSALLGEVAREVIGIDCCADTVAYAAQQYQAWNIQFQKQHVELTSFESASFDVVVSFETVEHTLCPKQHINEVARLLEPSSGIAILSIPNRWGLTPYHFFDFDYPMLKEITSNCFESVEWYYHNSGSRRGKSQVSGIGPLVDLPTAQAECILAVCAGPRIANAPDRLQVTMDEVYVSAFQRHREYLEMLHRERKRPLNRLRRLVSKYLA